MLCFEFVAVSQVIVGCLSVGGWSGRWCDLFLWGFSPLSLPFTSFSTIPPFPMTGSSCFIFGRHISPSFHSKSHSHSFVSTAEVCYQTKYTLTHSPNLSIVKKAEQKCPLYHRSFSQVEGCSSSHSSALSSCVFS